MRRVLSLRSNVRFVLFAALVSSGAATWAVLMNASAFTSVSSVRPAGEAAMARLNEAHVALAKQTGASAEADKRQADAAAAQMEKARIAAVVEKTAKVVSATAAAPHKRAPLEMAKADVAKADVAKTDAAKAAPAKPVVAEAAAPAPEKPAGQPVNLAFVRLAPEPEQAEPAPRRGFFGRITSVAGDVGAGALDVVSAAVRLPAKVLPSRFL